jgi:endonuclease/exonuclease/phosphatase family metal-dependent hydrolase
MKPLDIVEYDCRPVPSKSIESKPLKDIRVLQWNIERGYKLEKIISEIQRLDPDVAILQELDVDCERTQFVNVPETLAKRLQMHCVFNCEFIELDHPSRSRENAIGTSAAKQHCPGVGYHGNAILSKHKLDHVECFPHSANLDWEKDGYRLQEPREGIRSVLVSTVRIPLRGSGEGAAVELHCYNLHLEVFAGPLMRAQQLGDAVSHAQSAAETLSASAASTAQTRHSFIICGDLNTMAQGIARLSPKYCCDRIRWLGVGETEAEWLARNFVALTAPEASHGGSHTKSTPGKRWKIHHPLKSKLLNFHDSLLGKYCSHTPLGFDDPFDLRKDITLDNPKYYGWAAGKLDWMLLSTAKGYDGLVIRENQIGNHRYDMSDHKWLQLTLEAGRASSTRTNAVVLQRSWTRWVERLFVRVVTVLFVLLPVWLLIQLVLAIKALVLG